MSDVVAANRPVKTADVHPHSGFNQAVAVWVTNRVGSMWTAYIFCVLALTSLPAVLSTVWPALGHVFPHWLIDASLIALVAWVAQTFFQLVLLPVILVGQNVQQAHADALSEQNHAMLTEVLRRLNGKATSDSGRSREAPA